MRNHENDTLGLGRFHTYLTLNHTVRTQPREQVFTAIKQLGQCNNDQLTASLKGKISRDAVYRTIKLFLKIGIIEEIRPGIYELTDNFEQHHHYFRCRQCDHQMAFNDPSLEKSFERIATRRQLVLEDHRLELIGLCSACAQNPDIKPRPSIGTNLRRPLT